MDSYDLNELVKFTKQLQSKFPTISEEEAINIYYKNLASDNYKERTEVIKSAFGVGGDYTFLEAIARQLGFMGLASSSGLSINNAIEQAGLYISQAIADHVNTSDGD